MAKRETSKVEEIIKRQKKREHRFSGVSNHPVTKDCRVLIANLEQAQKAIKEYCDKVCKDGPRNKCWIISCPLFEEEI